MAEFLNAASQWEMGRNPMVRFLGAPSGLHVGAVYNEVPLISTNTRQGPEYLVRAMKRLDDMDFVLLVENLDEGYRAFFNVTAPHANDNSKGGSIGRRSHHTDSVLTDTERHLVIELFDLDIILYEYAVELSRSVLSHARLNGTSPMPPSRVEKINSSSVAMGRIYGDNHSSGMMNCRVPIRANKQPATVQAL